ncbi:MAG: lysozyme [Shewanella sp.]|nr:lysozyme [Shewanella sp.]
MKASQNCITLIKEFEGFKSKAYRCPAGVITIGIGHTSGVKITDTVTFLQAEEMLRDDLIWAERAVNNIKSSLNQNQFDALVSLVFNIGAGAFAKSTLLKLLNKSNFAAAAAEFSKWNKVSGKPSVGLTRRRAAEMALFLKSSDVVDMPQAVDSPNKPMVKSRTMTNASVAGSVGVALAVAPAIEPAGQVVELAQNNTQGFLLVLGLAIIAFATVAAYIRYSDRNKL